MKSKNSREISLDKKLEEFGKTLQGRSRNELISMLFEHFMECEVHKEEMITKDDTIELQKQLIEALQYSNAKNKAGALLLGKHAISVLKKSEKRSAYLSNILQQRNAERENEKNKKKKIFGLGRAIANNNRKSENDAQLDKLEKAIRDCFAAQTGRKISNKELEKFLSMNGLIDPAMHTAGTLAKKIGKVAAKIRRQSQLNNS